MTQASRNLEIGAWRLSLVLIQLILSLLCVSVTQFLAIFSVWICVGILYYRQGNLSWWFGCLSVLVPLLGAPAACGLGLSFAFFVVAPPRIAYLPFAAFLGLATVGCITEVSQSVLLTFNNPWSAFAPPFSIFNAMESILGWQAAFAISPPTWLRAIQVWVSFFAIATFSLHFSKHPQERGSWWDGAQVGAIVAAAIFVLLLPVYQFYPGIIARLPSFNLFFIMQGRLWGTFSDPNACGVWIGLVLPLVVCGAFPNSTLLSRKVRAALLIVWLGLLTFTGSRSAWVAIVGWLVLISAFKARWRYLFGIAGILAMLILLAGQIPSTIESQLPSSASRLVSALSYHQLSETLFSRTVFNTVGGEAWLSHPWFGVGFERFREIVVPLSAQLHFDTGVWSDNPNNFYLGVLCEFGIVGILFLISGFLALRWTREVPVTIKATIGTLGALLLLGPHIYHPEVAYLTAILLSCLVANESEGSRQLLSPWLVLAFIPAMVVQSEQRTYGLYSYEERDGEFMRWTAREAQFDVPCDPKQPIVAQINTPGLVGDPLKIELLGAQSGKQTFTMDSSGSLALTELMCSGVPQTAVVRTKLFLSRTWTPGESDWRQLGVLLTGAGVLQHS